MRTNSQFVQMIREATLESHFNPAELHSLQNPQESNFSPSHNPDLCLSIKFFMLTLDHLTSQRAYADTHDDILEHYPDSEILSYDQVKQQVSHLSGVHTWKHDMHFNSCAAFTGPFSHLERCPLCHKHCYDLEDLRKSNGKKKVPWKVFTTFPLGPKLQARWRNPQMASKMSY